MRFRILFIVSISHAYYSEGCKDFNFIIPADSAQLLRNGKLIAKMRDGKLCVLLADKTDNPADKTDNPFVTTIAGKTLRFGLKLLNPFFSNFTNFNFISSTPIYRNSNNSNALDAVYQSALVGQIFSHSVTNTIRPVMVILKDTNGQVLRTDTITATNNRSTVSYDLTGQSAGVYHLEEVYPGNTKTATYYSDAELQRQSAFGVVEIKIENSFYTKASEFEIAFDAKEETLKYYVVVNEYSDEQFNQMVNQLKVEDNGFEEDKRSKINFDSPAVVSTICSNAEISPSNPIAKVVLFKSQTAVTRQEKARKKIQLKKNGEVLIPHLPQPSANKVNADLIVHLSKPKS